MAILGIDLGTSNSAAAVCFDIDKKNPVTVEPVDGTLFLDLVFPSYVAFDKQGKVSTVGLTARERYFSGQSELVVRHFKRLIGRPYDYVVEQISKGNRAFSEFENRISQAEDGLILVKVGEKEVSVAEIASHLLRKIVEDTRFLLKKRGEDIEGLTISLPAGFDDSQRQATVQAARMAGLKDTTIQVIEEPTAAALAKGLSRVEGSIMVIDVGAGTTDVVIGHMEINADGIKLITTSRDCDDTLGGIDMDNMVLEYMFENDHDSPKLAELYPELDADNRLRLSGRIEEAKISASRDGKGTVSLRLPIGGTRSKQISMPLDVEQLAEIVAPIINGYTTEGNHQKGVRPVIMRALLKAAGGDAKAIPQVIKEIEWLILVGAPCRMECMRSMLKDVFTENEEIIRQIDATDPMERFFMEGVAQGSALSQTEGMDVTTSVPWTVSIFSMLAGVTPVLAAGTPYSREKGVNRGVRIPVHGGSNQLWILSQKESQPMPEWSMRNHIINVPQDGELRVNLVWGEGGAEADKASVEGCGLPGVIQFPQMSNTTTLGASLEGGLRWYLAVAKDLRKLVALAREPLVRWLIPQAGNVTDAERLTDEWLRVSESDLRKCDAIDVDEEGYLTETDINLALNKGYFEMRKQVAVERELLSTQAAEVLDKILPLLVSETPASTEELINESNELLSSGRNCADCVPYWQQLTEWLRRLELSPNDPAIASATVTSLGALADCLYSQKVISEDEFSRVQDVCWRFYAEG